MPVCFTAFPAWRLLSRMAGVMCCPAVSPASPSREQYRLSLGEKEQSSEPWGWDHWKCCPDAAWKRAACKA